MHKEAGHAAAAIRATSATNKIVFQGSYWDGAWNAPTKNAR